MAYYDETQNETQYEQPEQDGGVTELARRRRTRPVGITAPQDPAAPPAPGAPAPEKETAPASTFDLAGSRVNGRAADTKDFTDLMSLVQRQSGFDISTNDAAQKTFNTIVKPMLAQQGLNATLGGKNFDKVTANGKTIDWIGNAGGGVRNAQALQGNNRASVKSTTPSAAPVAATGGGASFTGTSATGAGGGVGPAAPVGTGQRDDLYNTLLGRSKQALTIDAQTDPNIRQQADTYAAAVERERRRYMGDTAEREGPLANIQGEERLSSEKAGQASAAFESQLVGRELQSRRDEIAESLKSMQGMLSQEQQLAMQRELAQLDASIRNRQISSGESQFGADLGLRRELGRGNLAVQNRQISSGNDQFMADLGLKAENQNSFWDAKRSGLD